MATTDGTGLNLTTAAACLSMYESTAFKTAQWIRINRFYIQIPLVVIGALLVLIAYGRNMFKRSHYLYMCVLAIADMSYIGCSAIFTKLQYIVAGHDWGGFGCGLIEYTFLSTQMFAVGVLVCMMFERMLVTLFPPRAHFFSVKKTAIILVILFIATYLISVPSIYSQFTVKSYNAATNLTFYYCKWNTTYLSHLIPPIYIKMYVFYFGAMAILLACSIIIVVKLTCCNKGKFSDKIYRSGDVSGSVAQGRVETNDLIVDITKQVMSVSICFLVLAFPFGLYFVPSTPLRHIKSFSYCENVFFKFTFSEIANFLYDMQHCLNAFLYSLVGWTFRRELWLSLCCRKEGEEQFLSTTFTEVPPSDIPVIYGEAYNPQGKQDTQLRYEMPSYGYDDNKFSRG